MFKVLDEVCTPTKGSKYSACIDLYAREDVVVGAGETVKIPLGVCIDGDFFVYEIAGVDVSESGDVLNEGIGNKVNDFMKSHYLSIHPRSSIGVKGLIIPNGMGIIDLDYRDEIMLVLHNPITINNIEVYDYTYDDMGYELRQNKLDKFKINKGDKIAQVMLCEHKTYLLGVDTDEERTGGFGSTNKGEEK